MQTSIPSNWGQPQLCPVHLAGSPQASSASDTLSILFGDLVIDAAVAASPGIATAAAVLHVPWRLGDRRGFTGFHVDVRGAADGDGEWSARLLLVFAGSARIFDLTARGDFIESFDAPPPLPTATPLVLVPVCVLLTVQRGEGAFARVAVDSLDIVAQTS